MSGAATPRPIALPLAVAGMTLAEALRDASGGVLLPQDSVLTEATLLSLRRRGIEHCVVWEAAAPVDPAQLARQRAQRLERLAYLFRHSGGVEAGALLLERLQDYRDAEPP